MALHQLDVYNYLQYVPAVLIVNDLLSRSYFFFYNRVASLPLSELSLNTAAEHIMHFKEIATNIFIIRHNLRIFY